MSVDAAGNVYFAEGSVGSGSGLTVGDFRIWRVSPDGTLFSAAGNGSNSFSGDTGAASRAQLNTPTGMAIDAAGNLYFADTQNHRIRRISPGGTITTVAGNALPGFSGDGGPAALAELNTPTAVAIDNQGRLYIADSANNRIRRVAADGTIDTVVGNGNAALFGDGGAARAAALHGPRGVALDSAGNLYIADTLNHCVRMVDTNGQITTAVPSLDAPRAVAVGPDGTLYVADAGIRMFAKGLSGTVPGTASATPLALAVDPAGDVFYTDGNRVIRVGPDGNAAAMAGTGACCYAGDGAPAAAALLNQPAGLAIDAAGNVYIADTGNNAIRLAYLSAAGSFIRNVTNGASNLAGAVSPGEIVTVYGAGLGPAQLSGYTASAGMVPKTLAGTTVLFNGIAGPVLYTEADQVAAVVPYGVSGSAGVDRRAVSRPGDRALPGAGGGIRARAVHGRFLRSRASPGAQPGRLAERARAPRRPGNDPHPVGDRRRPDEPVGGGRPAGALPRPAARAAPGREHRRPTREGAIRRRLGRFSRGRNAGGRPGAGRCFRHGPGGAHRRLRLESGRGDRDDRKVTHHPALLPDRLQGREPEFPA